MLNVITKARKLIQQFKCLLFNSQSSKFVKYPLIFEVLSKEMGEGGPGNLRRWELGIDQSKKTSEGLRYFGVFGRIFCNFCNFLECGEVWIVIGRGRPKFWEIRFPILWMPLIFRLFFLWLLPGLLGASVRGVIGLSWDASNYHTSNFSWPNFLKGMGWKGREGFGRIKEPLSTLCFTLMPFFSDERILW